MAGTCRVHLLGGFTVEVEGRSVPPETWKHRGHDVVKILALTPGHRVARDEVLDSLWPMLPEREGEDLLHKALKEVRKALGDNLAVTEEGAYLRLWPHGALWVDVHTFLATAKHARLPEQLAAALALYGGDLLPEDAAAAWTEPRRAAARQAYLDLLPEAAEAAEISAPRVIDLREALTTRTAN